MQCCEDILIIQRTVEISHFDLVERVCDFKYGCANDVIRRGKKQLIFCGNIKVSRKKPINNNINRCARNFSLLLPCFDVI